MTNIYCDGSTTNICYIIGEQKPIVAPALQEGIKVTNNEGEYYAVLKALIEARKQGLTDLVVYSDSQLIVNQVTTDDSGIPLYKSKERRMQDLRNLVWLFMKNFNSVELRWTSRNMNPAGKILERL